MLFNGDNRYMAKKKVKEENNEININIDESTKIESTEIDDIKININQDDLMASLERFADIDDGDIEEMDGILETLATTTIIEEVIEENVVLNSFTELSKTPEEIESAKKIKLADKRKELKAKTVKNEKKTKAALKKAKVRTPKVAKHPGVLYQAVIEGYKCINLVISHKDTHIYHDGADFCPKIRLGHKAYGKKCTQNAFERLTKVQDVMREHVPSGGEPEWLIIQNDTSVINDRNLLARLSTMMPHTHAVGAYGFTDIRSSGKWYKADNPEHVRGSFTQCNMDSLDWHYMVGHGFKDNDRYKVSAIYGPFIAVRYETFMDIDFTFMTENSKDGFFHYMVDICLEVQKRGKYCASLATQAQQYDRISNYFDDPNFIDDHSVFITKWQETLQITCRVNKNRR